MRIPMEQASRRFDMPRFRCASTVFNLALPLQTVGRSKALAVGAVLSAGAVASVLFLLAGAMRTRRQYLYVFPCGGDMRRQQREARVSRRPRTRACSRPGSETRYPRPEQSRRGGHGAEAELALRDLPVVAKRDQRHPHGASCRWTCRSCAMKIRYARLAFCARHHCKAR